MQEKHGILRHLGGRLAPPSPAQRSWRLALVALLLLPQTVVPATITVDDAPCTLVDAITSANTDAPSATCPAGDAGADTIDLTVPVALTASDNYAYSADNGLPVITTEITIEGNGYTIERTGGPAFRLFAVSPTGTLALNDATVSGGDASRGGGIYNRGTTTLTNSTVSGNYSYDRGGGIRNRGTTTLTNSTVSGNTAFRGGGIGNDGTTTLTNSTVSGNNASFGGGIYRYLGTTTLTSSILSGNTAYYRGGGIYSHYGTTTLTNSTVSGNYAGFSGGGIYNRWSTTTLTNSTVSENDADFGGGIYNYGDTYVYNTVLSGNTAGSSGASCFPGSGGYPVDGGNNFSENGGCGAGFAPITSGVDIDPILADNGGPTETHALFAGSVAIDAAGVCGLPTDQRGEPRSDGACDSGSYEFASLSCEETLRSLADYILALPLSDFVGSSAARRSILASRAIGAANSISFCAESSALIRLQSLIRLVDGIGRDYMTTTPNDVTTMAQDLYDTIDVGECPECAP